MKKLLLLPLLAMVMFACESESADSYEDENDIEETGDSGEDTGDDTTDDGTGDSTDDGTTDDSGNDDGTEDNTDDTSEDTDDSTEDNTDDDSEANNETEDDVDGDGIANEDDTCLNCEAEDFDFDLCDLETYAEVTITNDDGTTEVEQIPYTDQINYDVLTGLTCTQLNTLYVTTSTPTETCLTCDQFEVCENEDGTSYTATHIDNGRSVSFPYEEGETFESLTCDGLLAKAIAYFATTN